MIAAILCALLPPLVTQVGEYLRARSTRAHGDRIAALEARIAALESQARGNTRQ